MDCFLAQIRKRAMFFQRRLCEFLVKAEGSNTFILRKEDQKQVLV